MSYNFQSRKQILTLRGVYSIKVKTLEFASKEAAAPYTSVAARLWFWKFLGKILKKNELFSEILKVSKIMKDFEKS